jgi:hypothetical protein
VDGIKRKKKKKKKKNWQLFGKKEEKRKYVFFKIRGFTQILVQGKPCVGLL